MDANAYRAAPSLILIPAFTQIRHLTDPNARELAAAHNSFFTFAENIARADCLVPADGFAWQPTRQPDPARCVARHAGPARRKLDHRDAVGQLSRARIRGTPLRDEVGFVRVRSSICPRAPARSSRSHSGARVAPRDFLRAKGWRLLDPLEVTRDPWSYQEFIRGSKAEFSVAKHGYVASRSGWFSERSAAYLASGRPVLTQQTGFSDWLQTGAGLLAFETMEEALAGIEEIDAGYEHHCRAARAISRSVLRRAQGPNGPD